MSDLTEARAELARQYRGYIPGEEADVEAAIDALLLAHRSALAGETEQETMEKAVEAALDCDGPRLCGDDCVECREERALVEAALDAAAPILRAPLLVQLQDKNERIKAYETLERWLEDEDTYMSFCGEDVRQHGPLACLNRWRQKFPKEAP